MREDDARARRLDDVAGIYLDTITHAVRREYPNHLRHPMRDAGDRPTPREVHPAFYGCLDWHSAVEMHWALVRLLRLRPDAAGAGAARAVLDENLTAGALTTEAAYFTDHRGFERPYGWGWALTLAHELSIWDDPDARRWAANLEPLAGTIVDLYLSWLPRATYPSRGGAHDNSAFGLVRALPYARARSGASGAGTGTRDAGRRLSGAIEDAARHWFGGDRDYPAGWEPGGADFLSPALTEAELMAEVLPGDDFAVWFGRFLPGIADGQPASLFQPAIVSDPTDGQIAHLHGLNLYRAYAMQRLVAALPAGDARVPVLRDAADRHAGASLPAVCGGDWMVEHWLACYAVLLLGSELT